jgi:chromosomal replication initiation ATPase DnaA
VNAVTIVWEDGATSLPLVARGAAEVVQAVAQETGVRPSEILGRDRSRHVVAARHRVWAMLHRSGWSAASIGREFGVDHTSVLYALGKPWSAYR